MKRFLLTTLLLTNIILHPAAVALANPPGQLTLHTPAQGNLLLGDNGNAAGIQRGIIMDTIMNNPNFADEEAAIRQFCKTPVGQQITLSYQQIVQRIRQSTDTAGAIAVIEAFEKAIMNQYHYDTYAIGSYRPWQSIFITGIKYSWINPIKWINPCAWVYNKDSNLDQ